MVRADVLNAIDVSLRKQRESDAPLGGVRVIAFGASRTRRAVRSRMLRGS